MALVVENGAQIENANSYVDLTYAASYHTAQGNTDWSGEDTDLERALSVACRALEQLYGADLKSCIARDTQERLFPRMWFTDNHGRAVSAGTVPTCWKEAQCEVALLYLQGIDVFPTDTDAPIKSQSVKVGELETSTEFWSASAKARFDNFRKVELLLKPILRAKPTGWRIRA